MKKQAKKVSKKSSKKRLSIFDLQEGKTYSAFKGNRLLGKHYRIANGTLENSSGEGLGEYEGCSWIPVNADVTFEEAGISDHEISVLFLQPGVVYEETSGRLSERIARKGSSIMLVNSKNVPVRKIELESMDLSMTFRATGTVKKTTSARR